MATLHIFWLKPLGKFQKSYEHVLFLIDFREGEREGEGDKGREREKKKNSDQLSPIGALMEAGTHSLSMCPDWELNPQPFSVWDSAPTN